MAIMCVNKKVNMLKHHMTDSIIDHVVIGGGGPLGLRFLGVLQQLEQDHFFTVQNVKRFYGTSAGAIVCAMVCLGFDWETLVNYVVCRPWHSVFKVNADTLCNIYTEKGMFNIHAIEDIFKPLLLAKGLMLDVTLQQFFDATSKELHVFTFDVNKFQTVELTHATHPHMTLVKAVAMSAAFPGMFSPIFEDEQCFIDGGMMCNFPMKACLRDCDGNASRVLGLRGQTNMDMHNVTSDFTLDMFFTSLLMKSIHYMQESSHDNVSNIVVCSLDNNVSTAMSPDIFASLMNSADLRREWVQLGKLDASQLTVDL